MKGKLWLFLPALLLLSTPALAGWELDNTHTGIHFKVRYLGVTDVRGNFERFTGNVVYDEGDVARSTADVTIDAASINTRIGLRDRDLRGSRFLDVEKYPVITFKSKRVEKAGPGKLRMIGDLTLHGVTREVALDVTGPTPTAADPDGRTHVGGSAETRINRKDYGVSGGALLVGSEVTITIDVHLVKKGL
jgi:polyisoprenoid-binding protein YceI